MAGTADAYTRQVEQFLDVQTPEAISRISRILALPPQEGHSAE